MANEYYDRFRFFFKNKYNLRLFFLALLGMVVLSYIIDITPVIFLIVLCVLNTLLLFYDRYVQVPIDIELSTLSAVIMTLKYGLYWGIAAGVLTKVCVIISNKDFNSNTIVSLTAYALVAILANLFRGLPLLSLGILIAVLVNIYIILFSRFILFMSSYEVVMYSASNIFFNIIFFIIFVNISSLIGI
jgi:hypothetical protein